MKVKFINYTLKFAAKAMVSCNYATPCGSMYRIDVLSVSRPVSTRNTTSKTLNTKNSSGTFASIIT